MMIILEAAKMYAGAGAMSAVYLLSCAAILTLAYMAYKTINNLCKKWRMYRRLRRAQKRQKEWENEKPRVFRNGREE